MKHNINLLLLVVGVLFIFTSKADQLTITFTNPVPDPPVNCGDIWSEQGIEMDACSFSYGNGNLSLNNGDLNLYFSDIGLINKITLSIIVDFCCTSLTAYNWGSFVQNDVLNGNGTLELYEFENQNSEIIDQFSIYAEGNVLIFDITIDYTPICEIEPISNVRNGDVYLNDACYGVIMTSPSGNCFRAKVADNGMLFTEPVDCP